jgi:deazaflavin-dependent oxidoreductase (nitroreductase family)
MDQRTKDAGPALSPGRLLTFGRRVFGPLLLRSGIAAVLQVPGRRTGKPVDVTLALWQVDATRYLMSQYGATEWVRNLRAAGRGKLRQKGGVVDFMAIEVEGDERDRVIDEFRSKADALLTRDFDRLPSAADHPTFRIEPIA